MQWKTHQVMTATTILALTGNPYATIMAAMGSILPDSLEFMLYGENIPRWKHRKWTHWPLLYLLIAAILFALTYNSLAFNFFTDFHLSSIVEFFLTLYNISPFQLMLVMLFWITIGALLHILQDALSGKVPLIKPQKRNFGINLIETGSKKESILNIVCSILLILFINQKFLKL